jgi:penicillin-binding protein 1A
LVIGLVLSVIYFSLACTYDLKEVVEMPARTEIHDRNGKILKNPDGKEIGFLHGTNRRLINYEEVPPHFVEALIAQEDKRFRKHGAVDFYSMGRVAFRALTRGKLEGGGTISMQLARNTYQLKKSREGLLQGIHRKLLETFIAVRIESEFPKNDILEHYMNRIFWGGSIRGVEMAAQTYFDKSARDLSLEESALLVGIIRAPNRFSPFRFPDKAKDQRDWVLTKMVENKAITEDEKQAAGERELKIAPPNNLREGTYALDAIRRDLTRILEEENIRDGGLIIETTIDPAIQRITEMAVEKHLATLERRPGYRHQKRSAWNGLGNPRYLQGAAVVIDNETGAILATVGGRSANESQFNRALQAKRQIGSLFKPFIFLAAFDKGLTPNQRVSDAPLRRGEIPGAQPGWSPANSDKRYFAEIPARRALIESRNTSSVRIGAFAGMDSVIGVANAAGFDIDEIDRVPSSFLGSWGSSPEVVASAYTIFPNGGTRFRPYHIQAIKDRNGKILWENGPIPYRAAEASSAWTVSRILEEVNKSGTGRSIWANYGFRAPSGGKTGTSNGPVDGWYAGFTSALTCAVWVGMDGGETIIPGTSGASLALPIWVNIMKSSDRLPHIKNGNISPARALIVEPANEEIPQARPVDPSIPQAIPVN